MSESIECSSCGAQRDGGFGPCGACGAVRGDDNRCASCKALAGVREVSPDSFVCLACAAPRRLRRGTHVSTDFVAELDSRARMARLTSRIMNGFAVLAAMASLAVAGVIGLASGIGAMIPLLVGAAVAGGAVWFARVRGLAATADEAMALERRVLQAVRAEPGGVTVEAAVRATRKAQPVVDGLLTDLARRGSVDMDIDDDGTIRYRVVDVDAISADDEADDEALAELGLD